MDEERDFARTPSGYLLRYPSIGLAIEARNVRWEHGALYAVVSVRTKMPGVKVIGDTVAVLRVNLSSDRGRTEVAKACENRGPAVDLDWRGFMEEFSISVLAAEAEGRPFELVGNLPPRIDPGHAFYPRLPKGKPAVFYGPGGAGKGFLMVALSISHITGLEIVPGFIPHTKGKALYLDWEADRYDIDDRAKRICKGLGIGPVEIGYRECVVPLIDQVEDIAREVHQVGYDFIVVDSAGMAQSSRREGGDANESTRAMFQALRLLPATSLIVDHVIGSEAKAGGRSSKPYGSIYKENLARNTYEIRTLTSSSTEEDTQHLTIRHSKHNMSGKLATIGLAVRFAPGEVRFFEEEVVAPAEGEAESPYPTSTRQLVRSLLEQGHMEVAELADETGRKGDTIERVLRRYGTTAKKTEDRWFNKLPSGKWENLPLGPVEVDADAG